MLDPRIQAYAVRPDHVAMAKDIAAWRAGNDQIGIERGGDAVQVASIADHNLRMRDGVNITARVYQPLVTQAQANQPLPVYLYYHGGGWVIGSIAGSDRVCRALAQHAQAVVVSVNYRMAPEVQYPVPLDDASDALAWVCEQAQPLNIDSQRIVLSGDSAGAHLALTVALRERQVARKVAGVLAIYPCLNPACDSASMQSLGQSHGLTRDGMRWYWEQYLGAQIEHQTPDISPWFEPNLAGMPPTWILTAAYDPLRDEAEEFAQRLRDAGVLVATERQPGMLHGFIRWRGVVEASDLALKAGAQWMGLRLRRE
jgi:acetyl esterase